VPPALIPQPEGVTPPLLPSPSFNAPENSGQSSNRGLIIGLSVGLGLPFVLVMAFLVYSMHFRKRDRNDEPESVKPMSTGSSLNPFVRGKEVDETGGKISIYKESDVLSGTFPGV